MTFFVLNLVVFIDAFGVALVVPNLIFIFSAFGGSPQSYGLLSAVYSSAQLCGGLVLGYLGDRRLGHMRGLLISFAGASIAYLLVACASSIRLLILSRIIVGLCKHTSTFSTALVSVSTDRAGRAHALSRLSSAVTLASLLGAGLGGTLAQHLGRQPLCLIASVMFSLNFMLVQVAIRVQEAGEDKSQEIPKRASTGEANRSAVELSQMLAVLGGRGGSILLLRLMYGLLLRAVYSMHALYEAQEWALTPAAAGYLSAYSQLLSFAVEWGLVGRLVRHVPERLLLFFSLAAAAINSWIEWHHRSFPVYFLVHLPVGAMSKSIARACLSSLFSMALPPSEVGLAFSVLNVCQSAVSIIAPLWGGLLLGHVGIASQPAIAAVNYAILLLLSRVILAKPAISDAIDSVSEVKKHT